MWSPSVDKISRTMFGGSEQKSESVSNPVDLNPFASLRPEFGATLQELYRSGGAPEFSGRFGPAGAAENRALAGMEQGAFDPTRRQYLQDSMEGKYLPGQPGGNPFFTAAVEAAQRPTLQGLQRTLSRGVPSQFLMGGHSTGPRGSSAFDRAGNIAIEGAQNMIGDIATKMGNEQFTQGRQLQQNAVQLSQADLDGMVKNLTAQSLPRAIDNSNVELGLGTHNKRIESLMAALQMMAGITSPNIANQQRSTSSGTSETGVLNAIGNLGKGLGSMPKVPGIA